MRWAILLLIACPFAVQAAFYKCKDEDGNVVFSDTACSTQGDREQVNVRQAPPPRQQPQDAPTWAARAQAADQAKADSDYHKQRVKLVRELEGTTVSTNQIATASCNIAASVNEEHSGIEGIGRIHAGEYTEDVSSVSV